MDTRWRTPGKDWWEDEFITAHHEAAAIAGGPADVMITHESPAMATPAVQRILGTPDPSYPPFVMELSRYQRERVQRVWDTVGANILLHGHMHVHDEAVLPDGRRVVSLDCDNGLVNVGMLTLESCEFNMVDSG